MARDALSQNIRQQFSRWTLVGPFFAPSVLGQNDLWFPVDLDGTRAIPQAFSLDGKPVTVKPVRVEGPIVDFHEHLGHPNGSPQAYALMQLEIPEACTVSLTYDADWYAAWWLDGQEIFDTRGGNSGTVGEIRFPIALGLTPGRHTLAIRVISGVKGWKLIVNVEHVRRGILDILRNDRDARWRDYTQTVVRHENRPAPDGRCGGAAKEVFELACANSGVDARWIGMVDGNGSPYFPSACMPTDEVASDGYERQLRHWVSLVHRHKISAMTWYPMVLSRSAWLARPDWRQQYLVPPQAGQTTSCDIGCCINSGYGQALIDFSIEVLERFDLDGIWFDGSAFTPIWQSPQPVSCTCPACAAAFGQASGMELPARYDWSLPEMRRFVQWRYDSFSQYWQRLVDSVHAKVPQATIVFNHYHRENIGWNSAVPLRRFGRNFVSGIEVDDEPLKGDLHTRMMRAYGRATTEAWMTMNMGKQDGPRGPHHNPRKIMDFGLACATAGGHASFGGGGIDVHMPTVQRLADELHARKDYLNLPAVPYLALHISQQTETFVFGRNPAFTQSQQWKDYYWNSVVGWHHALAFNGRPCDVIFDEDLTASGLKDYPLLLLPLPVALETSQYEQILRYARAGGTVIAGPWFGLCDRWGQKHTQGVGDRAMLPFGQSFPSWDELEHRREFVFELSGDGIKARMRAKPLAAQTLVGRTIRLDWGKDSPVIRRTTVGKGQVIQLAVDMGTLYRYTQSPLAVQAVAALMTDLPRPIVETVGGTPLLTGMFRKGRNTTVVHVQQFAPPYEPTSQQPQPPTRWDTTIRWNGPRPTSVRCALPEVGPALPVRKSGRSWTFVLPPITWGQVILIET
jgi:hypothetical protein